jgi:hypothetical protein
LSTKPAIIDWLFNQLFSFFDWKCSKTLVKILWNQARTASKRFNFFEKIAGIKNKSHIIITKGLEKWYTTDTQQANLIHKKASFVVYNSTQRIHNTRILIHNRYTTSPENADYDTQPIHNNWNFGTKESSVLSSFEPQLAQLLYALFSAFSDKNRKTPLKN